MSTFAIISDSACDLNKDLRERFGLDDWIGSEVIFPDGHMEAVDLDWSNITPEEYFGSMADKKKMYKSAAPGPELIKTVFRKQLDIGNDILCVTLSSGMSAVYDHCCLAARDLMREYPERKIRVVDSKRYSTALSLMCVYANDLRKEGKSLDETADWLEANRDRFHQSGWMDDLFFLARAGRLSKGTAVMGTMIGVKPMADFNLDNGMSQVIGKARGYTKAFRAVVEYMKATVEHPEDQIVFVAHTYRKEQAEKLADMIRQEVHPKEVILNTVGQACGANIGPGLVATYYFGAPISKNLTRESKILQEILK